MTANRRIFLNIVATYGRSLFSLACGVFTARWILQALGKEDFGLYGVIGGLTIFISFINNLIGTSIVRFYSLSIGRSNTDAVVGLEDCRRWFNTALMLHLFLPLLSVLIGYPICVYAIRNWLTIPPDRVEACVWVFRFVTISCMLTLIDVPFSAMYRAKQYIAELTIYSFAQVLLNFWFFYYMSTHPADWLVRYALWMCIITCLPYVIIDLRALLVFKECKVRFKYWCDWRRVRQLAAFAGWHAVGALGGISRGQGLAILINQYFGAGVNAAMTIANQVNGHTQNLAAAMQGAFSPAIIAAYGANNLKLFKALSFRACKFGMLLVLVFIIPLSIELPGVIRLWLKTPPPYTVELCWCMMMALVADKSAIGHMIAVNAHGKIAMYQSFLGGSLILTLPLAWLFVIMGLGVYGIGYAWSLALIVCAFGRVWFARRLVGFSAKYWLFKILSPILFVSLLTGLVGLASHFIGNCSCVVRVVLTTLICEVIFLPLAWRYVLDFEERDYVRERIKMCLDRFRRKSAL